MSDMHSKVTAAQISWKQGTSSSVKLNQSFTTFGSAVFVSKDKREGKNCSEEHGGEKKNIE